MLKKEIIKLTKKERIIILISIIIIALLISTIIIQNMVINNQISNNEYYASGNENSSLIANNIRKGITIGGITGKLEILDTSDANATPEDLLEGKTAYVNGVKITGTYKSHIEEVEGVTIPKAFYYVGGAKDTGIVISDSPLDENKYSSDKYADQANIPGDGLVGNQFVWIPVENISDFKRYPNYGATQSATFNEPASVSYRYQNEVEEYNNMMQSVEENHGFYVARYEAGKEKINGVDTIVSKKGATVWTNIAWGNSTTDIGTEGAVAKAKGMYVNQGTYDITGTLIYGTQWDAIMAWIDPNYKTTTCAEDSFVRNSSGKGNYDSSSLATCGSSDNYRVKNIYDLAGNAWEWGMETDIIGWRVARGGCYSSSSSSISASYRYSKNSGTPVNDTGFRVVLCL